MEESTETQNKSSKTVGIIALVFFLLFVGGVGLALFKGNKGTEMKKEEVKQDVMQEENQTTNPGAGAAGIEGKDAMMQEEKTFTVEAANFSFTPKEIKVKKGETVTVVLTNTGTMPHNFVIDEYSVKSKQINNTETDKVTFVADKAGTFEYYCSVGNHRKQGMIGKLIVE